MLELDDDHKQNFILPFTVWWIVVISVLSIILNTLLAIVIVRKKWSWTIDIKLVFCLSIVDILLSFVILAVSLGKYFAEIDFNGIPEVYCQISGVFITMVDNCTLLFLSLLSYERYVLICKSQTNIQKKCYIFISIYLILGSILAIIAASMKTFKPSPSAGYCTLTAPIEPVALPYFIFIFITFNVSLFTITYCYCKIILTSKKQVETMKIDNINETIGYYSNNMNEEENPFQRKRESTINTKATELSYKSSTRMINSSKEPDFKIYPEKIKKKVFLRGLLFIIIYIFCFIPNLISWWYGVVTSRPWPYVFDVLIICTFHFSQFFNPLLALTLHSTIRAGFLSWFKSK
ncbi:family A G protein-coupled receptor-like protein [Neoconidiobolus thromboides FSU 785]|nr:family A G protein-coupled receptor-like protein [Neoconidiobolus thromboides FSU 785]